jgi:hypothetical protein
MAHAWFLERALPSMYSLKNNVVRGDPSDEKLPEEEIPAEVLARHRALTLELARKSLSRASTQPIRHEPDYCSRSERATRKRNRA